MVAYTLTILTLGISILVFTTFSVLDPRRADNFLKNILKTIVVVFSSLEYVLILIFYKDLDYDDLSKHKSKTQNAYYFGLVIVMTRVEVVILWIVIDFLYSVFVTVTYFGVLSEEIKLIYIGILAHLMYAVCCVCRIVYVAFKLSKTHEHEGEGSFSTGSTGSFGKLCSHMFWLNLPYIGWYLANCFMAFILKKLRMDKKKLVTRSCLFIKICL